MSASVTRAGPYVSKSAARRWLAPWDAHGPGLSGLAAARWVAGCTVGQLKLVSPDRGGWLDGLSDDMPLSLLALAAPTTPPIYLTCRLCMLRTLGQGMCDCAGGL